MQFSMLTDANPAEMEDIGRLRTLVWTGEPNVNPLALGPEPWIDPADSNASQWTVRNERQGNGRLVASARITIHNKTTQIPYHSAFPNHLSESGPYASMNRLVVHPDVRGRGIARILDCLRLRHAPRLGAALVIVIASGRRVAALESLGFENLGPPCETPELLRTEQPYRVLVHRLKDIPRLPVIDWSV